MSTPRAQLLASQRGDDRALLASVAKGPSLATQDRDEAWAFLVQYPQALVLWDADDSSSAEDLGRLFASRCPSEHVFALGDREIQSYEHLFLTNGHGHFIQRRHNKSHGPLFQQLARASHATDWGMAGFFGTQKLPPAVVIKNSEEKGPAVEAVQSYLQKVQVTERLSALAAQGTDELIMNAMFDAPIESPPGQMPADDARRYRRQTERFRKFALNAREEVLVQVHAGDAWVGICVIDQFGSLSREGLNRFLRKDYELGQYTVWKNDAGAGLGIHNMLHSGLSIRFLSVPGVRTEVQIYFPRCRSYKDFKESSRFVSLSLPMSFAR